jgi:hypothetical protein
MLGCYDKPTNQPNPEAVSFLAAECSATSEKKKSPRSRTSPADAVNGATSNLGFFLLGFAFFESKNDLRELRFYSELRYESGNDSWGDGITGISSLRRLVGAYPRKADFLMID